ncbi:MAG TPA: hypothetical protein PLB25_06305 [Rhodoferax sp.]|nr:hypothetical protein [Rhodoferax sp.]
MSGYEQRRHPMSAAMTAFEALWYFIDRDGLRQQDQREISQ